MRSSRRSSSRSGQATRSSAPRSSKAPARKTLKKAAAKRPLKKSAPAAKPAARPEKTHAAAAAKKAAPQKKSPGPRKPALKPAAAKPPPARTAAVPTPKHTPASSAASDAAVDKPLVVPKPGIAPTPMIVRPSLPPDGNVTAPTSSAPGPAAERPAPPKAAPKPPPPKRPLVSLTIVTRKSPLAVTQAEQVMTRLTERLPQYAFKLLKLVTTGDRQETWSLEQQGGQGLFTSEIEAALHDRRADIAVHSAKDLPTDLHAELAIAGYLPREDPRDVLVLREGLARPSSIATGSPRRRLQLQRQFTKATFVEIRGNVDTRLRKIAEENLADATVLAAAGLNRLGIKEWPGLRFQMLPLAVSVPAAGQGAIAVQARTATSAALRPHLDEVTARAVELERAFLRHMGEGCHTAFAAHYDGNAVHIFHESCGYQRFAVPPQEASEPVRVAERLIAQLKLKS